MCEKFFEQYKLSFPEIHPLMDSCEEILQTLKTKPDSVNMGDVFRHETYVVFRGVKYSSEYDLERGELIFGQYENMPEYNPTSGRKWWNLQPHIEKLINKIVGLIEWD